MRNIEQRLANLRERRTGSMNINHDNEDGLDPNFNTDNFTSLTNDSLITPPSQADKHIKNLRTVSPTDNYKELGAPTAQDLLGDDIELGTLPQIKADFAVVTDQTAKIVTLKEVEDTILSNGVISQEDAKQVDHFFTALFSPTLSIKEYTKQPSRTNHSKTAQFMQGRIATEEIVLKQKVQTVLAAPFVKSADPKEAGSCVLANIEEYIYKIDQSCILLTSEYQATFDTITDTRNYVCQMNDEGFVNILTQPMSALTSLRAQRNKLFSNFLQAADAILAITKCPYTVDYLTLTADSRIDPSDMTTRLPFLLVNGQQLTLLALLQAYQSGNIKNHLPQLQLCAADAVDDFNRVNRWLEEEAPTSETSVYDYVVSVMPQMTKSVNTLHYVQTVVKNIAMLNYAMQGIMQYLAIR